MKVRKVATPDSLDSRLRQRLYAAYVSTHEGAANRASAHHAFRRDILAHLPHDRTVEILDIGCGQGELVRQLHLHGYVNARGVDISLQSVEAARTGGIAHVEQGDYREFLRPTSLDVVIGTDFFEHLTKPEALDAADRVRAALRPGGRLILRVPNAASPFSGRYQHGDLTHETAFTSRSLAQLAAAAGFVSARVFSCPPPVHGAQSAARAALWRLASGVMKAALAAETGQVHGHLVTQNIVAVMDVLD